MGATDNYWGGKKKGNTFPCTESFQPLLRHYRKKKEEEVVICQLQLYHSLRSLLHIFCVCVRARFRRVSGAGVARRRNRSIGPPARIVVIIIGFRFSPAIAISATRNVD